VRRLQLIKARRNHGCLDIAFIRINAITGSRALDEPQIAPDYGDRAARQWPYSVLTLSAPYCCQTIPSEDRSIPRLMLSA